MNSARKLYHCNTAELPRMIDEVLHTKAKPLRAENPAGWFQNLIFKRPEAPEGHSSN